MSLFQSNLRKQIRNLPKILNFVKKNHYYSELFTSLLSIFPPRCGARSRHGRRGRTARSRASPGGRRGTAKARSCDGLRGGYTGTSTVCFRCVERCKSARGVGCGAMHECITFVDLDKCCKMSMSLSKCVTMAFEPDTYTARIRLSQPGLRIFAKVC